MTAEDRNQAREAIALLVRRKEPDLETFVEEFATNISSGGMFLRTKKPAAVGTELKFAIALAGGKKVMRGVAKVQWVRQERNEEGPPGMGLRFLKLNKAGIVLVKRLLLTKKRRAAKRVPAQEAEPAASPAEDAAELGQEPQEAAGEFEASEPSVDGAAGLELQQEQAVEARPSAPPDLVSAPNLAAGLPEPPSSFELKAAAEAGLPGPALDAADGFDLDAELNADASQPEPPLPTLDAADGFDLDAELNADASQPVPPLPTLDAADGFDLDAELNADASQPESPLPTLDAADGFDLDAELNADASQPEPPLPTLDAADGFDLDAELDLDELPDELPELLPDEEDLADEPLADAADFEDEAFALEIDLPDGVEVLDLADVIMDEEEEVEIPEAELLLASEEGEAEAGEAETEDQPWSLDFQALQDVLTDSDSVDAAGAGEEDLPQAEPFAAITPRSELPPEPGGLNISFDELFSNEEASSELAELGASALDEATVRSPAAEASAVVRGTPLPDATRTREAPQNTDGPATLKLQAAMAEPKKSKSTNEPVYLRPPAEIPETGPVIGIDLGTSNSCVSYVRDGKPVIIGTREGRNLIPSMVALSKIDKLMVGQRALGQILTNPDQTIYGAKRLMGRPFDSAVVQQVQDRFVYPICADSEGRAAVQLGNNILSLEEVSGLILAEAKEMAEVFIGEPVHRAVITVPAYYSEPQRHAVRRAAALAGLRAERILNEPTAAALAFGLNRQVNETVLVYDLGGGTFDATVLKVENNLFEVLATAGDTFLGGSDFDNLLIDLLIDRFESEQSVTFMGDRVAVSRIKDAVERAKIALSESLQFEIQIPFLMMDEAGKGYDLNTTLLREEFETLALPLIDRTLDVVRDVLLDAKLKTHQIDSVILVGGQSRMPLIRIRLEEALGLKAHAGVHADEAVALGAGLLAASLDKVSDLMLVDVLPMTIGVGLPGGGFKRIIERNTQLPTQETFVIPTTKDHQKVIEVSVFQGEDENVAANDYLGTLRIEDLPKAKAGKVRLMVTLRLDSECVLHLEARELSTKRQIKAELATRYSPAEIQKRLHIDKQAASAAVDASTAELGARSGRFGRFLRGIFGSKTAKTP